MAHDVTPEFGRELGLEFGPEHPIKTIVAALQTGGVCVVRSLYPKDVIDGIDAAVTAILAGLDAQLGAGTLSPDIAQRHAINRAFPLTEVVVAGTPAVELLTSARVQAIGAACLGRAVVAHPQISYVRAARPEQESLHIPYHQDSRILGCELVNLWIPLCACGRERPGLE